MSKDIELVEVDGQSCIRIHPDAAGTVAGLARLPYEFEQAIAELIDNSISAGASRIDVKLEFRITKKVYVHVLDNGSGISKENLPFAITYGSRLRKLGPSLSVYGFGMKTAAQSFTNKFSLVSKTKDQERAQMIIFDQILIQTQNDYLYPITEVPSSYNRILKDQLGENSGTLIVTEDANHFFPNEDYPEDKRLRFIRKKEEDLCRHIAMTYQRFLDHSDLRAPNIEIFVNDEKIEAWDPFCVREGLKPEASQDLALRSADGKEGILKLRAYLLPKKHEFSSPEAYENADVSPSTHGFYVYRENRLMDHATYFDIVRRDTHYQLLRIDFSYDSNLDEIFKPALNKNKAFLGYLRDEVENWLRPLLREADRRSREQGAQRPTQGIHDPSQKKIKSVSGSIEKAKITPINENLARVESNYGVVELPIPSLQIGSIDQTFVYPVESIQDGILWQMRLIDGEQAVALNKNHEFYQRFYFNVKGAAAQAMDMLLYALTITEARCTIKEHSQQLEDFRFQVSRTLNRLAQTLPEPSANIELNEDE